MPRFLKTTNDLYRDMGVQKLSQATAGQKKLAPQIMADMLWGEDLPARQAQSQADCKREPPGQADYPKLAKTLGQSRL